MSETRSKVIDLIDTKLRVKREVFEKTKEVFALLKESVKEVHLDLEKSTKKEDPIELKVSEIGSYEIRIKVGGDTIVFLMHSNVFDFEESHKTKKLSYVRDDKFRSYCGQIYVYNFLNDSFKYNRVNDLGYLVARVFVNKDKHYFVEGNDRLSFLFNDFDKAVLDKKNLCNFIDEVIAYSLDFDLFTPPYRQVAIVTVDEINQASQEQKIQTGKRLGFKFKADRKIK